MAACGLWPSGRRVVAVVVDDDGRACPPLIATNDDERWELLAGIDAQHGLDCELVFPEDMLRRDTICRFVLQRHHVAFAAPRALIDAIRRAAGLRRAARTAAMIARLAVVPPLRQHLRRVEGINCDSRQLLLL